MGCQLSTTIGLPCISTTTPNKCPPVSRIPDCHSSFLFSTSCSHLQGLTLIRGLSTYPGLYLFFSLLGVSCCRFIGFHFLSLRLGNIREGLHHWKNRSVSVLGNRVSKDWNWNWTSLDVRLIRAMSIILNLNIDAFFSWS